MTTPSFEQGPIRPPSEAHSLLVRVIRNCAWNRCTFCPVYKGARASVRSREDILADLDAMAAAAAALGGPGASSDRVLRALQGGEVPPEAVQVALFLREGGRSVFLQDADPCAVRPDTLVAVLERVRRHFPTVECVTSYGRAATVARRKDADLARLVAAGLSRLHLGLESGSDAVLEEVCKGVAATELIEAGRKSLAAGFELCFYVMPGLGGRARSEEHVEGTVAVLRAVARAAPPNRPLVVRLRTTAVAAGTPLEERAAAGEFELPDDVEIVAELRGLLDRLSDARLELRSDHALNLLPELEGSLPADRERLLEILDEYLGLSPAERAEFAMGARLGVYRRLADRHDRQLRALLHSQLPGQPEGSGRTLLDAAAALRSRFI